MPRKIAAQRSSHLLIQGATVVDPGLNLEQRLDVLIEDGIITAVMQDLRPPENAEAIQAQGLILSPGWFDMHVHFREPGREDEETVVSGCAAAVAGGFTGACPMPNTEPAMDSPEIVADQIAEAHKTLVDVHPIAAATKGRKGQEPSEIAELRLAGAVAFSDDGCSIRTAELVRRVLEYADMFGCPVIEHAEEPSLVQNGAMNESKMSTRLGIPGMPSVAEDIIVARDIALAEYTGGHLHIAHISSRGAIELVRLAKQKGLAVTCEATPHHFTLTDEAVASYDSNTKMNPPLRTAADVAAVIAGLQDGIIDVIATDHAPHAPEEKEVEFAAAPFGIVGLETAMGLVITQLVLSKKLTLSQALAKVTVNPRRILNLPQVQIKTGQPANLTLFSVDRRWKVDKSKLCSKSRNTPFDGWELNGSVWGVFNKGQYWSNPDF